MNFLLRYAKILLKGIDFAVYLAVMLVALCFFYFKVKIVKKVKYSDDSPILFISSGKVILYPGFENKQYKKEWHFDIQKQFLSWNNSRAFVFFNRGKKGVYKVTKNVIGIVSPHCFENSVFFKNTVLGINFWRDYLFISKLLKKHYISTIACYVPSDQLLLSAILKQFLHVKLYASVMGNSDLAWSEYPYQHKKIKKLLLQIYEKIIAFFFFQKTDLVLAYNNHIGDYALCNGAAPEKIRRTRIYPCIKHFDDTAVLPKEELKDFPKTKKVLIMWSRFSYEKKIPFALKGAIHALEKDQDLGLCMIGYGPLYEDIKDTINKSMVKDRVSLIGFIPSFLLLSYIYHSDVALIPLGGFSMLEACILKKPIVCFDIEWHHELLTDGYSGYFADYPNSRMICDKLLEAISNPEEAKVRGQRAYERFRFLFDEERILAREKQIFRELSIC